MKALLLTGAALGGLLLLTNKSASAAPPTPLPSSPGLLPSVPTPVPSAPSAPLPAPTPGGIIPTNVPPAVVASINAALDTLDPDAINKAADALDAQGYKTQAADLRAVALGMRNAMQNAVT